MDYWSICNRCNFTTGVLTIPPLKTMFMIENLDIMELVKILALAFFTNFNNPN